MNEVEIFNELRNKKEGKLLHWAIQEDQEAEDLFSNCSVKKIKEEPQSVGRLWEKKGVVSGKIQGKLEPIKERAKDFKLENNKKSLISKKGEAEVK